MSLISGSINLIHFIFVACILFSIGILGILINRDSPINIFISVQIIFMSIILSLVSFSVLLKDLNIRIFSIFVSMVMVVEFIIGVAILFIFYKDTKR